MCEPQLLRRGGKDPHLQHWAFWEEEPSLEVILKPCRGKAMPGSRKFCDICRQLHPWVSHQNISRGLMRLLSWLAEASIKSGKHHDKVCSASPKLLEENKRWLRKGGWVKFQMKE